MDLTTYIAGLSMGIAQSNVAQNVSTAMMSKAIDSVEAQGEAIVDMLNSVQLPPAGVKGHLLDVRA